MCDVVVEIREILREDPKKTFWNFDFFSLIFHLSYDPKKFLGNILINSLHLSFFSRLLSSSPSSSIIPKYRHVPTLYE